MKSIPSFALLLLGILMLSISVGHAELKSPQSVKGALRLLNRVVGQTGRLVASKDLEHVGGEQSEFAQGAKMLRDAIVEEPVELRARVEPALQQAFDASTALSDAGARKDESKAAAAHEVFADKIKAILELFPEDLRPSPILGAKAHTD